MIRQIIIGLLLCFLMQLTSNAQEEEIPYAVTAATSIGLGRYNIMDTYLTPGSKIPFKGGGIRILDERMKLTRLADSRVSRQQLFDVDLSLTDNGAGTTNTLNGFIDYSLGYHYRFEPINNLTLLAGASARLMAGFIYSTKASNNPASVKADFDLNISAMVLYHLSIRNYPMTLRYQVETPFIGMLFSPHFGQSYYEIFDQGNSSGIVPFTSFHNKQAMRNYLSVDFPVGKMMVRTGYLNSLYYLNVNGIQSHIISHSFTVGIIKEFVVFGGKRIKQQSKYKSAYY